MYRQFYGLSHEPFNLNPDPKFLYLAQSHYDALSSMLSGINERKRIIVITGEAGVGKTLLIYAIMNDLPDKVKSAFIFHPTMGFQGLIENILLDLDVRVNERKNKLSSLLVGFRRYLHERLAREETVAVVIDDAQVLDNGVLESLLRFSTVEDPPTKMLQVLLVGHPGLEEKLKSIKLRHYKEKIGVKCRIRPFTLEEGREYVKYRLKLAGREISEIFTSKALSQVWKFSRGIPRVMNLLCERALLIGYKNSSPIIDSKIIKAAMKDFNYLWTGGKSTFLPKLSGKISRSKILGVIFFRSAFF